MTKEAENHTWEPDEKSALYEGVSVTTLSQLFHMDKKKVSRLLVDVKPAGRRRGYPIYKIADAASRLAVPPDEKIVESLRHVPMNKLPVHLQKEFWDAARSRQTYERDAGDLWRTEDILDVLTEILKGVRTSVTLFVDAVARETELTEKQRALIEQLADDLLENMHNQITTNPRFGQKYNMRVARDLDAQGDYALDWSEEPADDLGLGDLADA